MGEEDSEPAVRLCRNQYLSDFDFLLVLQAFASCLGQRISHDRTLTVQGPGQSGKKAGQGAEYIIRCDGVACLWFAEPGPEKNWILSGHVWI